MSEQKDKNYTYIVECSDGTLYTGWTNDIEKRLKAHNEGKGAKYTRCRKPGKTGLFRGIRYEQQAMSREAKIKQLSRQEKEKLIDSNRNR